MTWIPFRDLFSRSVRTNTPSDLDDVDPLPLVAICGGIGMVCPPPPVSPPVSCPAPAPALPSLVGTPSGAIRGSVWVEGSELHYISDNGTEWAGTGTSVDTPSGAVLGSCYLNSATDAIYYIDSSGVRRALQATSLGAKPAGAVQGSMWIDGGQLTGRQLEWAGATNRWQWWNGS